VTPLDLIRKVEDLGVVLAPAGDGIFYTGPKGALPLDLSALLVADKPAVLAALRDRASQASSHVVTAPAAPAATYDLIVSVKQLDAVAQAVRQAARVALDTETTGLDPIWDRPRLLQLAIPSGRVFVIDIQAVGNMTALAKALSGTTVIAHNALFDLNMLQQHCGLKPQKVRCAMTAARLLDGGLHLRVKDYCSLASVAERYLGLRMDKTLQTSNWAGTLTVAQIQYAAADVKNLFRLHDTLEIEIEKNGLAAAYAIECDLIPVLVEMYAAGVGFNKERWLELVSEREAEMARLKASLSQQIGDVNPNSHAKLKAVLQALGCEIEGTGAEELGPYMDRPYVQDLLEYRHIASFVRGPGRKIAKILGGQEGNRVHAAMNPSSAPTGRLSCSKPNLLALPKEAAVRRCIEPTSGHLFVCADYSAIELRVVADLTQDPRMLEVFKNSGDPHRATAALLLNKPQDAVTKAERQRAKAVNFGFVFGMGAQRFVQYARSDYGVVMSLEEATNFRNLYLDAYAAIAKWHKSIGRTMPSVVRTASGRWRRFDDSGRGYCERLNTPVQGTAADGLKRAMVLLHERLPEYGARMILSVHDEVLVETPVDAAEQVKSVVEAAMKDGMQEFVKSVPIAVEVTVRRTWSEEDVVCK
jgi:DNA polymerase-1